MRFYHFTKQEANVRFDGRIHDPCPVVASCSISRLGTRDNEINQRSGTSLMYCIIMLGAIDPDLTEGVLLIHSEGF
jgi:hypothetical protein